MNVFYFIITIIIIMSLLMIIFAIFYNKIQDLLLKVKEVESRIDESLRYKYDVMVQIADIIKKEELQKIKDLKDSDFSSFDLFRSLQEYESKMICEINGSKKLQKNEELKCKLADIDEINIKIDAEKRYYNDNVSLYNGLCRKLPSNIVTKIIKINEKDFFDGKDLNDKIEKDFKL